MNGSTKKPIYKIPSMEEINKLEPNGYKVVSTFAGCGGSSLGYRLAGYKVLWANEFVNHAVEIYKANHKAIVDNTDIRKVQPEDILKVLGLKKTCSKEDVIKAYEDAQKANAPAESE